MMGQLRRASDQRDNLQIPHQIQNKLLHFRRTSALCLRNGPSQPAVRPGLHDGTTAPEAGGPGAHLRRHPHHRHRTGAAAGDRGRRLSGVPHRRPARRLHVSGRDVRHTVLPRRHPVLSAAEGEALLQLRRQLRLGR